MREIKFRGRKSGYRSDKKEWVFGDYFYDGFHCVHCIREGAHIPPAYDEPGGDYYQEDHEINADTLGQYTGLKDKNGKEIYEGDVIVVPDTYVFYDQGVINYVGVVEMIFGCWQYVLHCVNPLKPGISSGTNNIIDGSGEGGAEFLIIGNVHENQELIKL